MQTTIIVCDKCNWAEDTKTAPDGRTGGEVLAEMIEARCADAGSAVAVRRQSCLMGCARHCNTAIAAPGKLTYVLGSFEPTAASAEAVVDYARLHAESETGQVPFKQWPQGVKGHFVARIPAVDHAE
ncbi:MAG: DUF1636 domain-containing protein [Pseudomonadota bacterium]